MSIQRKYLVVCRAGDNSLHPEWIKSDKRDFDLMIDYYGTEDNKFADDCEYYFYGNNGRKFSAIYKLISENEQLFKKYDAIWIADDDLLTDAKTINTMFDLFTSSNLMLAQPALTTDSYYSHHITLQNSETIMRYSFYCEPMAPIFSHEALMKCYHSFNFGQVGWGLDFIWPKILGYPKNKIAILDKTPVKHTRPVGKGDIYKDLDIQPREELILMMSTFGISNLIQFMSIYGGVLREQHAQSNLNQELSDSLFASRLFKGTSTKLLVDDLCMKQYLYPSMLKICGLDKLPGESGEYQAEGDLLPLLHVFTEIRKGGELSHLANSLMKFEDTLVLNILELYQGDKVELLNAIAIAYFQMEQHDRVMNFLTKAFELNNKDYDTLYNLGYVLYHYGERNLSLGFLEMVEDKDDLVQSLMDIVKTKE